MSYKYFIGILIFALMISTNCVPNASKYRLVPDSRSTTIKNVYGSFITVETENNTFSGEFIALDEDTLFALTDQIFQKVCITKVNSAQLTLVTNSSRRRATFGAISLIPSLIGALAHPGYSGQFLVIGGITAGLNLIGIAAEGIREPHIISYPEEISDIYLLTKYARFPLGFPEQMDQQIFEYRETILFD